MIGCGGRLRGVVQELLKATNQVEIIAISDSAAAADRLRGLVEQQLDRGFSELPIESVSDFAARLLRDEMPESGLDPFVATLSGADRLAMLIERVDQLEQCLRVAFAHIDGEAGFPCELYAFGRAQ